MFPTPIRRKKPQQQPRVPLSQVINRRPKTQEKPRRNIRVSQQEIFQKKESRLLCHKYLESVKNGEIIDIDEFRKECRKNNKSFIPEEEKKVITKKQKSTVLTKEQKKEILNQERIKELRKAQQMIDFRNMKYY